MPSDLKPRLMARHERATVVGPEHASRRDGDEHPLLIARDPARSCEGTARPRPAARRIPSHGPLRPGSSCHDRAAIGRAEHRGVFDAGVNGIGVGEGWLEMPDALELPRMRRSVVPLMRARNTVVHELVVERLPALAAIARLLDDLAKPAARLRRINAIRIGR